MVAAFDFAFCLWGGSVAEGDTVKSESLAELGESVREVGEKEGVITRNAIAFSFLRGAQMA